MVQNLSKYLESRLLSNRNRSSPNILLFASQERDIFNELKAAQDRVKELERKYEMFQRATKRRSAEEGEQQQQQQQEVRAAASAKPSTESPKSWKTNSRSWSTPRAKRLFGEGSGHEVSSRGLHWHIKVYFKLSAQSCFPCSFC